MNVGDKVRFLETAPADLVDGHYTVIGVDDNANGQLLTLEGVRGATCSAYAHEVELDEILDQPGALP